MFRPGTGSSPARSAGRGRAAPTTSYRRTAPPRFHTNIEIAPGTLPWTSSWLGEVTSASAMSALVSDTRAIGEPTSTSVDRPTSSRTASARARRRRRDGAAGCRRRRGHDGWRRGADRRLCVHRGVAEDGDDEDRGAGDQRRCGPTLGVSSSWSLLLADDFVRALVAADDFDGAAPAPGGAAPARWTGPRPCARTRRAARRAPSPHSAAGLMPRVAGAALSSGLRSAS